MKHSRNFLKVSTQTCFASSGGLSFLCFVQNPALSVNMIAKSNRHVFSVSRLGHCTGEVLCRAIVAILTELLPDELSISMRPAACMSAEKPPITFNAASHRLSSSASVLHSVIIVGVLSWPWFKPRSTTTATSEMPDATFVLPAASTASLGGSGVCGACWLNTGVRTTLSKPASNLA